jgi:hypothetical protein
MTRGGTHSIDNTTILNYTQDKINYSSGFTHKEPSKDDSQLKSHHQNRELVNHKPNGYKRGSLKDNLDKKDPKSLKIETSFIDPSAI